MIVSGFARPEFKVEVEVIAAKRVGSRLSESVECPCPLNWLDLTTEDFRTRDMSRDDRGPARRGGRAARAASAGRRRHLHQRGLSRPRRRRSCRTISTCSSCPCRRSANRTSTSPFPGTLTLSAETLIRAWTEIGESVHRAGVPQARLRELPRRQRRRDRHRRARAAGPARDARGERRLAPARLSATGLLLARRDCATASMAATPRPR